MILIYMIAFQLTHFQNLLKIWNSIKEPAMNSLAPSLIHHESDIIKRTLRDMFDENTQNIIVEGNEGYKKAQSFMKTMMPSNVKKVKKYRGKIPLFIQENIEQKLNQIFDSEIKLNSGGYLVLNPKEALVSIDINSIKAYSISLEYSPLLAKPLKIALFISASWAVGILSAFPDQAFKAGTCRARPNEKVRFQGVPSI